MCLLVLFACQYELTLVASDGLNENATRVIIHINDVNDMMPEFTQPLYQAVMAEELAGPYPYRLLKVGFKTLLEE